MVDVADGMVATAEADLGAPLERLCRRHGVFDHDGPAHRVVLAFAGQITCVSPNELVPRVACCSVYESDACHLGGISLTHWRWVVAHSYDLAFRVRHRQSHSSLQGIGWVRWLALSVVKGRVFVEFEFIDCFWGESVYLVNELCRAGGLVVCALL